MGNREEAIIGRLMGLSYEQIGESLGISRQRVQQLVSPPAAVRELIVKRAKGKCQKCGIFVGKSGHIHHIGAEEDYNDIDNLQLLCLSCHWLEHKAQVSKSHLIKWLKERGSI